MLSEDDKNERRVLIALLVVGVLFAAKLHGSRAARRVHEGHETAIVMTAPAPQADARTSVVITPGQVTLLGAVPSESERASLVATAKGVFPASDVTETLHVVANEPTSATVRALLAEAGPLRWGTLSRTARALVVEGEIAAPKDPAALEAAFRRVAAGPVTVAIVARRGPSAEPHVLEATLASLFAGPLEWAWNGATLDVASKAILDPLVPYLAHLEGLEVTIAVTPNPAEPPAEWQTLALARAEATRRYLVERGADERHLVVAATHLPPEAPPKVPPTPKPVRVDARFFVRETRALK